MVSLTHVVRAHPHSHHGDGEFYGLQGAVQSVVGYEESEEENSLLFMNIRDIGDKLCLWVSENSLGVEPGAAEHPLVGDDPVAFGRAWSYLNHKPDKFFSFGIITF